VSVSTTRPSERGVVEQRRRNPAARAFGERNEEAGPTSAKSAEGEDDSDTLAAQVRQLPRRQSLARGRRTAVCPDPARSAAERIDSPGFTGILAENAPSETIVTWKGDSEGFGREGVERGGGA